MKKNILIIICILTFGIIILINITKNNHNIIKTDRDLSKFDNISSTKETIIKNYKTEKVESDIYFENGEKLYQVFDSGYIDFIKERIQNFIYENFDNEVEDVMLTKITKNNKFYELEIKFEENEKIQIVIPISNPYDLTLLHNKEN